MSPRDLEIDRDFAAPLRLVWANWTRSEHVGGWFAPDGYEVTACDFAPAPGASWRVVYRSPRGVTITESGSFVEVVAFERLVFTLTQDDGTRGPETRVEVTFTAHDNATRVQLRQSGFESDQRRDGNGEGWDECLRKLDRNVVGEHELRALFAAWARDSSAKDLDGAMRPVAADVLSFEHEAPLAVRGVAAVRAACQAGFAHAPADFIWSVPDLEVFVRDDIGVTWGINRMQLGAITSHSRGTRVFRRIEGRWQMIHQHVSFPYDPATGQAMTMLPMR